MAINPSLCPKLPYDPVRDFTLITPVVHYYYVIAAHGSLAPNNEKELVAAARAKPGTRRTRDDGTASRRGRHTRRAPLARMLRLTG